MVILNLSKSSCRFNFTKSVNFALFLLNLFFRAVSGLHKNEQKLQSFPVYLSAPQMRDLLHYQYPPTKWHICYSDEPTLKCQNHPEHIVYICLAYSMGFEKCLMKCNKLLHIENRFIAPQIPLQSMLPHNIKQSSLCYTTDSCCSSILYIAVCTCPSQTPFSPFFLPGP